MNIPRLTSALPVAAFAALLFLPACSRKSARPEPVTYGTPAEAKQEAQVLELAEEPASPATSYAPPGPLPAPVSAPRSEPLANQAFAAPDAAGREAKSSLSRAMPAKRKGMGRGRAGSRWEKADKDLRADIDDSFHTEEYDRIYENPFLDVRNNPLSTFSIDVDAASYANVRRFLQNHQLPPADAVRIEELINYFDYDYPQPDGEAPFSITAEVASTPWNAKTRLVHVGLQGVAIDNDRLPPGNLVFLIDVSGSMEDEAKLPLLRRAFRLLVEQLRPQDKVSMVVYAGAAGVVLPPTPGSDKAAILEALERLSAGGSTAGGEGIRLAYEVAARNFVEGGNNRILLATDGDFNVGVSSDAELVRLVEEKRKGGVFLSVLGFGMGNYKDSKMEQIADKGNGNYAYIDNIREARKVLVEEMGGTLVTIAKDVKLQMEFNPAKVEAYRLIGYENRMLRAEDFNDDTKDAGELGAGHSVTALYEVVPAGTGMPLPGVDPLKYQRPAAVPGRQDAPGRESAELLTVKFRYKDPNGSRSKLLSRALVDGGAAWERASGDFRFSAAAAGFGMLLRGSRHKGTLDYAQVLAMAKEAAGRDARGHRAEFIRLVESARLLASAQRMGMN